MFDHDVTSELATTTDTDEPATKRLRVYTAYNEHKAITDDRSCTIMEIPDDIYIIKIYASTDAGTNRSDIASSAKNMK